MMVDFPAPDNECEVSLYADDIEIHAYTQQVNVQFFKNVFYLYSAFSTNVLKGAVFWFSSLSGCDTHHSVFNVILLNAIKNRFQCAVTWALLTVFPMAASVGN